MYQTLVAETAASGRRVEARRQEQERVGTDGQRHRAGVDQGRLGNVNDRAAGDREQPRAARCIEDALVDQAAAKETQRAAAELVAARAADAQEAHRIRAACLTECAAAGEADVLRACREQSRVEDVSAAGARVLAEGECTAAAVIVKNVVRTSRLGKRAGTGAADVLRPSAGQQPGAAQMVAAAGPSTLAEGERTADAVTVKVVRASRLGKCAGTGAANALRQSAGQQSGAAEMVAAAGPSTLAEGKRTAAAVIENVVRASRLGKCARFRSSLRTPCWRRCFPPSGCSCPSKPRCSRRKCNQWSSRWFRPTG